MFWYLVATVAAVVVLSTLLSRPGRRLWVFYLLAARTGLLWSAERLGLRRLWYRLRRRPHVPLAGPQLARQFCEDLGPTFVKFGQIVASSAGMFPEPYVVEFGKCLDRVRPFSFADVQEILAAELGAERAAQLGDISAEPLASASIAQVHTAVLADGTPVVVKVQRPFIDARMDADVRIMRGAALVLARLNSDLELMNPVGVVDDFAATLREELDFRQEAANLDRFNEIMRELGHSDVRAPVPHWALTTRRVLVMERFSGTRADDVAAIRTRGIDAGERLVHGLRAWLQCVMFYGFFHGDVHAGNLMLLDDGAVGFLDFGIVGRFDQRQRELVTDYIIQMATGNFEGMADTLTHMGSVSSELDRPAFVRDLAEVYTPVRTTTFGQLNYSEVLPRVNQVASRHRMRLPREFVLITKQLLYFDRYAKLLAPELNIFTHPRLIVGLMGDVQRLRASAEARRQSC
jgi:predicted unusual protein kinase regulating ubiquinone biosynthesis (AarF/ABC1/UbiB family)